MIKIEEIDGELRVDSRLIAEKLGNQHKNVIEMIHRHADRLEKYGRVAVETLPIETNGGTQSTVVCFLNERQSTFLVTLSKNSEQAVELKQNLVDSYYHYKEQNKPKIPETFAEALQLAADQAKQLEEAQPAIKFHEQVGDSEGLYSIGETAKLLGVGRNRFFKRLREEKIFMGTLPYQSFIDRGYFEVKTSTNNDHVQKQAFCSPKGLQWIHEKFTGLKLDGSLVKQIGE